MNRRFEEVPRRLNNLRLRLYRSPNGLALGVFRGIAECLGYCVLPTRIVGCILLLMLSGSVGAHGFRVSLLVAGFFYLLAAVLMRPPQARPAADGTRGYVDGDDVPPPMPAWTSTTRPAAVPYQQMPPPRAERVDFVALDRQFSELNRRIQHMEGIVTDRGYDWDRRMEG